jgi:uncharacterized protein YpiB (UPF0302 family)
MSIQVGFGELMAIISSIIAGGWILLQLALKQFEKRLEEKFTQLATLDMNVKRLEMNMAQVQLGNANTFTTRQDFRDYVVEQNKRQDKIFDLLREIDNKLDTKADKS